MWVAGRWALWLPVELFPKLGQARSQPLFGMLLLLLTVDLSQMLSERFHTLINFAATVGQAGTHRRVLRRQFGSLSCQLGPLLREFDAFLPDRFLEFRAVPIL